MPERGFDSGFWGKKWVRHREPHGRYLYIYLKTNDHCNPAGVYEITVETMAFETGLHEAEIPDLLRDLTEEVKWLPDEDIIWVKNFIKEQSNSPKFFIAAAKCLKNIKNVALVEEVVEYYRTVHRISIPYEYPIDRVSIPSVLSCPVTVPGTGTGEEGVVKGEEPEPEGGDDKKAELLKRLRALKLWRTTEDDVEWLDGFLQQFPEFDVERMTACVDYHSGRDEPGHKGVWKNRFRNWMLNERQFALERKDSGQRGTRRVSATRGAKDFSGGKW